MRSPTFPVLAVVTAFLLIAGVHTALNQTNVSEAPAAFDSLTNGSVSQATFDLAKEIFEEREEIDEGLGPVFNASGCAECHMLPIVGGTSQINEFRAGRMVNGRFEEHPGGSLIHDRAIDPSILEVLNDNFDIRTGRNSLGVLGDGFVEAIDSDTLIGISRRQARETNGVIEGQYIFVPVLEANNALRVGRFGWKDQHASLLSFSADAYLNEMGITTPFLRTENTSNGRSVARFDEVPDPEDDGTDVTQFAVFMRASKAPPRDKVLAATGDAQDGEKLFNRIGCAHCHVSSIVTAPPGTRINGGALTVPPALGNKVIHPFGDFLLHDVGTGDGIVQNGPADTRNKIRTIPLWGLRTRTRFMHDGASRTLRDAIRRHKGEASFVIRNFNDLRNFEENDLLTFLRSL
jgi:CxxC motif-containing protein (DUF1111 family)